MGNLDVIDRREFRHEALLYAGRDDFVAQALPFIEEGLEYGESILVAVTAANADALRRQVLDETAGVRFVDMEQLGRNPARIISVWRDFVDANPGGGRRMRGIGEPIWQGRSDEELVECRHHEQLLNLAFADAPGFWLLCPYDIESLDDDLITAARCTHPRVAERGQSSTSDWFTLPDDVAAPLGAPLAPAPLEARELLFDAQGLAAVRRLVEAEAARAGLRPAQVSDFVIAVNELTANSVRHATGRGRISIWQDGPRLICEVVDDGEIVEALAGRQRAPDSHPGGRGLWLVNQLCDFVQVRRLPEGGVVRVQMDLA